jgi:hypothetical protein
MNFQIRVPIDIVVPFTSADPIGFGSSERPAQPCNRVFDRPSLRSARAFWSYRSSGEWCEVWSKRTNSLTSGFASVFLGLVVSQSGRPRARGESWPHLKHRS